MYVVVESVRNGYALLHSHLVGFVRGSISFEEPMSDPQDSYHFWTSLGVDSEVAETLSDLNLHWCGNRLCVSRSHENEPDIIKTICGCMLSVFRFRKFTDSRWLTLGDSCRGLVASLCLGLRPSVDMVRADEGASDYDVHGFGQVSAEVRRFAI